MRVFFLFAKRYTIDIKIIIAGRAKIFYAMRFEQEI